MTWDTLREYLGTVVKKLVARKTFFAHTLRNSRYGPLSEKEVEVVREQAALHIMSIMYPMAVAPFAVAGEGDE